MNGQINPEIGIMKLLFASSTYPSKTEVFRAANLVLFELIQAFNQVPNVDVYFLKLNISDTDDPNNSKLATSELTSIGIHVLPSLDISYPQTRTKTWFQRLTSLFKADELDYYPILSYQTKVDKIVSELKPDFLFIPWSEQGTALFARTSIPFKYAYYGNPDPKAQKTQFLKSLQKDSHFFKNFFKKLKFARNNKRLEKIHLNLMREYHSAGNIAANDAQYYLDRNILSSHYIQNIWYPYPKHFNKLQGPSKNYQICANVGKLSATANSLGLRYLAFELLPIFEKKYPNFPATFNIYGGGKLDPVTESELKKYPSVKIHGFVDDLEKELINSHVFLCTNNATPYKVCHTRYLQAWSLKSCVVAHKDATLSIPETQHKKNALLGKNSEEIADYLYEALTNEDLRKSMEEGGYQTFNEFFLAPQIVQKILNRYNKYKEVHHGSETFQK
ncbi:MAG: hypothetical protein CL678_19105 [Bdellovibrionaceae bacterium]|nr:hypothetical protein [Pseudobdellovibrionaceae bacterium]